MRKEQGLQAHEFPRKRDIRPSGPDGHFAIFDVIATKNRCPIHSPDFLGEWVG